MNNQSSDFIHYVLLHVIDPSTRTMIGLTKLKGPSFLLNKLTVPGGKREKNESILQAASREMLEESGLSIAEKDWIIFDSFLGEGYELTKLVATSSHIHQAKTLEDEPICFLNVDEHLALAKNYPTKYSPDFVSNLTNALSAISP